MTVHSPPHQPLERRATPGAFRLTRRVRLTVWSTCAIGGGIQAWHSRYWMNPDGISYLDLADSYAHGSWATALNAYWSPLYSWLLAAAGFVVRPSGLAEFAMAHAVNLILY